MEEENLTPYEKCIKGLYKTKISFDFSGIKEYWNEQIRLVDGIPLTRAGYTQRVAELEKARDKEIYDRKAKIREDEERLYQIFKSDCEKFFGFEDLPADIRSYIHGLAWDNGHAWGYSSVLDEYEPLVKLALLCYG